jgi:hypothetical protein
LQQSDMIGLSQIRTASMFADEHLARRRLSPDAAPTEASEAAARWITSESTERSEEVRLSLNKLSEKIASELAALVENAEEATRNEEHNRKLLEASIHDFVVLAKAAPIPTYEAVLQKMRAYVADEVRKREQQLDEQRRQLKSDELERLAVDTARWMVILDEVDEKLSAYARSREAGSQDQRRKEQIEQQLDVLEAKAMRQIPEFSVTRDPSVYIETQKEIFRLRREIKKLPGGRLKLKRGMVSPRVNPLQSSDGSFNVPLSESTSSCGSVSTTSLVPTRGHNGDEPLCLIEIAEKALGAQVEVTRISATTPDAPRNLVHRRSTVIAGDLQSLQSVMAQSGALIDGSFRIAPHPGSHCERRR